MKTRAKKAPKKQSASRWSLGLARNERGELITLYTRTDGTPMQSEKKRLNGGKILFHEVITGVKYSQARGQLIKHSGLKDEPVAANGNGEAKAGRRSK
jgi:hypothetical protein